MDVRWSWGCVLVGNRCFLEFFFYDNRKYTLGCEERISKVFRKIRILLFVWVFVGDCIIIVGFLRFMRGFCVI